MACKEFHSYVSPIDEYINQAYEEERYSDPELLEFAICFLEVNSLFFRSGYIKEEILRKLKRTELKAKQVKRLNAVLEHAVDHRGFREYKCYCRLAAFIGTQSLIQAVETAAKYGKGSRKSRAKLMLEYIQKSTAGKYQDI